MIILFVQLQSSCYVILGVDPSIFICFAALVDEFLEHTMRRQNASLKRA